MTSSCIYPYVYLCTHKVTNSFYIGYRYANVAKGRKAEIDFPLYRTSSKEVRADFESYEWTILAEFFTPEDAFAFEQQLIQESWGNPKLINKKLWIGGKSLQRHNEEIRAKMSAAKKGLPARNIDLMRSINLGKKQSSEHIRKRIRVGWTHSDSTKAQISENRKGTPAWNLGKPQSDLAKANISASRQNQPKFECPHCHKVMDKSNLGKYHGDKCKSLLK
jgi:hypothetical protein